MCRLQNTIDIRPHNNTYTNITKEYTRVEVGIVYRPFVIHVAITDRGGKEFSISHCSRR